MTHEELLAVIDKHFQGRCSSRCLEHMPWHALRAVMELHKPEQVMTGWGTHTEPTYKTICNYCKTNFPCIEFQAIEKELK